MLSDQAVQIMTEIYIQMSLAATPFTLQFEIAHGKDICNCVCAF